VVVVGKGYGVVVEVVDDVDVAGGHPKLSQKQQYAFLATLHE